jgi:hypothetical protein
MTKELTEHENRTPSLEQYIKDNKEYSEESVIEEYHLFYPTTGWVEHLTT